MKTQIAIGLVLSLMLAGCGSMQSAGSIESKLTAEDNRLADQAARYALENLPSGASWSWQNPATGHTGTVKPLRTWISKQPRRYCREYQEDIEVSGRSERFTDVACRNERGVWVTER